MSYQFVKYMHVEPDGSVAFVSMSPTVGWNPKCSTGLLVWTCLSNPGAQCSDTLWVYQIEGAASRKLPSSCLEAGQPKGYFEVPFGILLQTAAGAASWKLLPPVPGLAGGGWVLKTTNLLVKFEKA